MTREDNIRAAYLGCCNARGWQPTIEGLDAFRRDILRGVRDESGAVPRRRQRGPPPADGHLRHPGAVCPG